MRIYLMADIIRTIQDLNILLRDNVANEISPQDIRDLMVSQMVHGQIGSTGAASIDLTAGWNTIVLDSATLAKRGVTLDVVNYRIADIPVDMKVMLFYEVHFKGTADQEYQFTVWKNGGTSPAQVAAMNRKTYIFNVDQIACVSAFTAISLNQDDTIELAVNGGTAGFEVDFASLRLQRIGVE
jgi:hypothetical protein